MKKDIAIEEIREVRHRISEEHRHDTRALLQHYKELESQYASRLLKESGGAANTGPLRVAETRSEYHPKTRSAPEQEE
ncbi:hypothetical protein ACFL01_03765 [Planctomycetota bacterium]